MTISPECSCRLKSVQWLCIREQDMGKILLLSKLIQHGQESNLDQKSGASNRPHALRYDKNIIDSFLYE